MNTMTKTQHIRTIADPDEKHRRHLVEAKRLEETINELFRNQELLFDGTTKEEALQMTQFEQIRLLDRVIGESFPLENTRLAKPELICFLQEVTRENFRTGMGFK